LVSAQVIGVDTTGERGKYSKYGYNTVEFYTEKQIINSDTVGQKLDTAIQDFNRLFYFKGKTEPYQDLGVVGSPQKAYFYQTPRYIGTTLGLNALNRYAFVQDEIPFFNTKSPYSQLNYNRTFEFQESIDATYARNVSKNVGIGFRLRRMSGKHNYGATSSKIPYADHYSAYVNGYYVTDNRKLKLLGSYRWLNHKLIEDGGVYLSPNDSTDYNPFKKIALSNLATTSIRTSDRRNGWHFTGVYSVFDTTGKLNVFYSFDRIKRVNYYFDDNFSTVHQFTNVSNLDFYQSITQDPVGYLTSNTNVYDSTVFKQYEHKLGVSGKITSISYELFMKNRTYNFFRNDSIISGYFYERFLGGNVQGSFLQDKMKFDVSYEFGTSEQQLLTSNLKFYWLELGVNSSSLRPSILEIQYYGQVYQWSNSFKNKKSQDYTLGLNIPLGDFGSIKPFYQVANLENYIYYNSEARPMQLNSKVTTNAFGFEMNLNWKFMYLTEIYKNFNVTGYDVFRAPENYSFTRLALKMHFFKRRMKTYFGVDITYRSKFQSMHYMPITQQYYINDNDPFVITSQPILDFFVCSTVKNFTLYLKLNQLNQPYQGGYYITPYYPGVKRSIEMGINWRFYK